jgi:hypothetical protein
MLDALIGQAVHTNLDLRMAAARVREARALRGVAAADQFPTVTVSGAYSRNRLSENVTTTPRNIEPEYDLFQSGFDASWELDLFGRVRRTVEAASTDLAATENHRRDVLVTLLAEVARNYVDVRGFQWRLDITRPNIHTQQQTVELTTARFTAGLSSELDVAQARANLATTESQVPVLESSLTQAMHRLSVLLGKPPGALLGELARGNPSPLGPRRYPSASPRTYCGDSPTSARPNRSWQRQRHASEWPQLTSSRGSPCSAPWISGAMTSAACSAPAALPGRSGLDSSGLCLMPDVSAPILRCRQPARRPPSPATSRQPSWH